MVEHYPFKHDDEEVNIRNLGAEIGMLDKNVGEKCAVENVSVIMRVFFKKGIDEEVIAKWKKLNKGKGVMSENQGNGVRKERMARPKGNGVFIRDNVDPSCENDSHTNSKTDHENKITMTDKSDSEQFLKSFDYLSEGEYEAIVTVKNKDNWSWFLSLLGDDLDLPTRDGLTLISDEHKGLIEVVKEVMSYAEHRQCARAVCTGSVHGQCARAVCTGSVHGQCTRHIYKGFQSLKVRKRYDDFTIDEAANTMWKISCFPYVYVVPCIFKLNKRVETYVPTCFRIEMFIQAYTQFMKLVECITFWPDCSNLSRILGILPKMLDRPKKKIIRASHESNSTTKISKNWFPMTCHNYGQAGHNKKGCKNDLIPKLPKVKRKASRPKKTMPSENTNVVDDENLPSLSTTP
uniref:Pentatricopeptide repeat-containing protein n=1 Tax=Tanacetum cinerariifolium TaxID=118510 RepID=A0A699GIT9_TANCI|nr:pentatricopeptide repeat-containing protein [Tanacetum cinerariifolium]